MHIKFLKKHDIGKQVYQPGNIMEVDDARGEYLVKMKVAELVDKKKSKKKK